MSKIKIIPLFFFAILTAFFLYGNVLAEEVSVEIKVQKQFTNLKENQFTFELKSLEGEVLQTAKNKQDGSIVFENIKIDNSDDNKQYYKIEEVDDNQNGVEYDKKTIYVLVEISKNSNDAKVKYVKNLEKKETKQYNFFHATEEQLHGQAYAVYDDSDKSLTFFRDEEGKYTNRQTIDNKTYYTDFENNENYNNYTEGWEPFSYQIKKIIFKDAIKPKKIERWFLNMYELENVDISKLDTSDVTSFRSFFEGMSKLRNIDISTLDTSNVTDFINMFSKSGIESLDFSKWDMGKMTDVSSAVNNMPNLKSLNITNWKVDSSAELVKLPCLENLTLGKKYRIYRTTIDDGQASWIKLDDNKVYTSMNLSDIAFNNGPEAIEGEYVRPACSTETLSFTNEYHKPSNTPADTKDNQSSAIKVPNTLKNSIVGIIGIIIILIASVIYILFRKKIIFNK